LSTLKVLWKKIKPPSALYFQGLKAVFINTFCPITQYISKDKEKTSRWIKRTRLQLPFGLTTTGYIDSIAQNQKNTTHFSLDVD